MNAAELVARIEAAIPSYDGLHGAHAQTGDEYRQFAFYGDDEAVLCQRLWCAVQCYIAIERKAHPQARLFWRYEAPRVFWYPNDRIEIPRGRLQTRLVVTDRSVIWFSWEEYDAARRAQLERDLLRDGRSDA